MRIVGLGKFPVGKSLPEYLLSFSKRDESYILYSASEPINVIIVVFVGSEYILANSQAFLHTFTWSIIIS